MLESPLDDGEPLLGELLELRGWALTAGTIRRVVARIDEGAATEAQTGLQRSDVAAAFSNLPGADRSGFMLRLSLAGLEPGEHALEVRVEDETPAGQGWLRWLNLGDPDVVYRAWQERCRRFAPVAAADARDAGMQATWIVRSYADADRGEAEATAAALRRAGEGRWKAVVLAHDVDEAARQRIRDSLEGDWVGLLDAGDRVRDDAGARLLCWLADTQADLLYADHDHAAPAGPVDPVLKPGWSASLHDHPEIAARAWLVRRTALDDADWTALAERGRGEVKLPRALAAPDSRGLRVPEVLFTVRGALPTATASRPAEIPSRATVTVVVPSRLADRAMLASCLDGLRQRTDYPALDIVVALNNLGATSRAEAEAFLAAWAVRIIHSDAPFNWSALNNAAARTTSAPWLLFLNDDVEPHEPGWLSAMVDLGNGRDLGAVGAVLRYPEGSVQHAGMYIHGGDRPQCRHTFRHCSGAEQRVRRWLTHDRAQTAVTGACLLTRRGIFEQIGGFDEALPLVYNDVDYCLRLAERGLFCAVAARAELRHHEGLSRGGIAEDTDGERFAARWAPSLPWCDPFSHPSLIRDRDDWMFDPTHAPNDALSIP
ncbi:MAG: glycosyltransferase [Planctomycetota bacterium]